MIKTNSKTEYRETERQRQREIETETETGKERKRESEREESCQRCGVTHSEDRMEDRETKLARDQKLHNN